MTGAMTRAMTRAVARKAIWLAGLSMLALGAVLLPDWSASAQQQPAIQRKSLLQRDSTIPGFQAAVNIVEIPAGASEIKHTHPGPLTVYILEGTLIQVALLFVPLIGLAVFVGAVVILLGNLLNLGTARPPAAPSVSTAKVLGDRRSEEPRREGP